MSTNFTFIPVKGVDVTIDQETYDELNKLLPHVLRVASELEFNLPSFNTCFSNGGGNETAKTCLCEKAVKEACEPDCIRENCEIEAQVGCAKALCLHFISRCAVCEDYVGLNCADCSRANFIEKFQPKALRDKITQALKPLNSIKRPEGIHEVKTDGSLLGDGGGVEITTIAQRANFEELLALYKLILEVCKENSAFINERCSIHCHLLTQHLTGANTANTINSGRLMPSQAQRRTSTRPGPAITIRDIDTVEPALEEEEEENIESVSLPRVTFSEPTISGLGTYQTHGQIASLRTHDSNLIYSDLKEGIPEIVCINFHQLIRRYENAFLWMFSAGPSLAHLTRWEKFRQSILDANISPLILPMAEVKRALAHYSNQESGSNMSRGKYATMNYYYTQFDDRGNADPFHVEFRFADGHWVPEVIAAMACLLEAVLLKALDLSMYGLLSVGSAEEIKQRHAARVTLLNNNGKFGRVRVSFTHEAENYFSDFIEQSHELLELVKTRLDSMGPVYSLLSQLADMPISLRRAKGLSWEEIQEQFRIISITPKTMKQDHKLSKIIKLIDLYSRPSESEEAWIDGAAKELDMPVDRIRVTIGSLTKAGKIKWSSKLRTFVRS